MGANCRAHPTVRIQRSRVTLLAAGNGTATTTTGPPDGSLDLTMSKHLLDPSRTTTFPDHHLTISASCMGQRNMASQQQHHQDWFRFDFLRNNHDITGLSFRSNASLGGGPLASLLQALEFNTTLRSLDFSGNFLQRPEHVNCLAPLVASRELEKLRLFLPRSFFAAAGNHRAAAAAATAQPSSTTTRADSMSYGMLAGRKLGVLVGVVANK